MARAYIKPGRIYPLSPPDQPSDLPTTKDKVQRASGVIHLIVESVSDLTADLKTASGLDVPFPLVAGRVDEARHGGGGPDNREGKPPEPKPRDIYVPDTHIDTLKVKARNFR
jgi:error-prone DNA polymerase